MSKCEKNHLMDAYYHFRGVKEKSPWLRPYLEFGCGCVFENDTVFHVEDNRITMMIEKVEDDAVTLDRPSDESDYECTPEVHLFPDAESEEAEGE